MFSSQIILWQDCFRFTCHIVKKCGNIHLATTLLQNSFVMWRGDSPLRAYNLFGPAVLLPLPGHYQPSCCGNSLRWLQEKISIHCQYPQTSFPPLLSPFFLLCFVRPSCHRIWSSNGGSFLAIGESAAWFFFAVHGHTHLADVFGDHDSLRGCLTGVSKIGSGPLSLNRAFF